MKVDRNLIGEWVLEALKNLGGAAHHVEINKEIWRLHEADLRAGGDAFFKWQYEARWAGDKMQKLGLLKKGAGEKGVWALTGGAK